MKRLVLSAAAALAFAVPANAQDSSYQPGVYWDVGMIDVEDGKGEAYADWLATEWKRNQEFAKSKRWIKDYFVLGNGYNRPGEPDLYLVTVFDLWSRLRWPFGRFVVLVLSGVVPLLSFWAERRVVAEVRSGRYGPHVPAAPGEGTPR